MKKLLIGIFLLLFVGSLLMFQHVFNLSKKVEAVVSTLKIGGTGGAAQLFDFLRVNKSLGVGYDAPATAGDAIFSGRLGIGTTAPLLKLDVAGSGRFSGATTSVLTGSIDPIASTTVTGVGTLFLTELVPGDRITVTGVTKTVTAIASDTSLTVDTAYTDLANDTSPDKLAAIFVARDSSNAVQMAINDLGNIGIGKAAPGQKLDISGTANMTALSLGGTAVTATAAQLNFVSGVTSAIQTQLGLKAPLAGPTFTGTVTVPAPVAAGAAVTKSYVDAAGLTVLFTYCGWTGTTLTTCTTPACPLGYTSAGDLGCYPTAKTANYGSCFTTCAAITGYTWLCSDHVSWCECGLNSSYCIPGTRFVVGLTYSYAGVCIRGCTQ